MGERFFDRLSRALDVPIRRRRVLGILAGSDSSSARGERLDEFARALATPMPRRRALGLVAGAVVGTTLVAPRHALARLATPAVCSQCPDKYPKCCGTWPDRSPICCDPSYEKCCKSKGCCDRCTEKGTSPCGTKKCCGPDEQCLNSKGICCKGERCIDKCCEKGQECCVSAVAVATGKGVCCRPGGCCGQTCCSEDEFCMGGKCVRGCIWEEDGRRQRQIYDPKTHCCTQYGLEQKYPIQKYERCKETRKPHAGYKPTANGCGPKNGPKVADRFGKARFLAACNAHDICYSTCRKKRGDCDDKFLVDLAKSCQAAYPKKSKLRLECLEVVGRYYSGVRDFGFLAYWDAQSEACDCC